MYPKQEKQIVKDILSLCTEFNTMVRTRQERRSEKWKQEKVEPYVERISTTMFNISTKNSEFLKKQEHFYDAKMSQVEWDFLEDQRTGRKMYCTSFVDKRWAARGGEEGEATAGDGKNEGKRRRRKDVNGHEGDS